MDMFIYEFILKANREDPSCIHMVPLLRLPDHNSYAYLYLLGCIIRSKPWMEDAIKRTHVHSAFMAPAVAVLAPIWENQQETMEALFELHSVTSHYITTKSICSTV